VFILALGWFIKLLIKFSNDMKALEKRFSNDMKAIEGRVSKLEQFQAVDKSRWAGLDTRLERMENKIDDLIKRKD
jgi:hypothetical protein